MAVAHISDSMVLTVAGIGNVAVFIIRPGGVGIAWEMPGTRSRRLFGMAVTDVVQSNGITNSCRTPWGRTLTAWTRQRCTRHSFEWETLSSWRQMVWQTIWTREPLPK